MNALDSRIHDLFLNLVNSKTDHLIKIDYKHHSLVYKIDDKEVTLEGFTKSDDHKPEENSFSDAVSVFKHLHICNWDLLLCNPKNGLDFMIHINDKYYEVKGLSRTEYATVLDTLDTTIKNFENKQLEGVFSVLSTYNEIL